MDIPGIPESISREDYVRLVESIGLSVTDLRSLEFGHDSIEAEVFARDPETGRHYAEGNEIATHHIRIKVVDGRG